MPKQETRTLYTLEELHQSHPNAYARVRAKWERLCDESPDCPWQAEIMGSLRAVVEACGGKLTDWQIGPHSPSYLRVSVEDDETGWEEGMPDGTETTIPHDIEWFYNTILRPHGYTRKDDGAAQFPGLCPFTGYCADECFLESVWKPLSSGATLTRALEDLAREASRMMAEECENERGEETMLLNWSDLWFTETGDKA